MQSLPSKLRLATLIFGSVLFSLSVVNLFRPVFPLPRDYFFMIPVFALAVWGIFFGRSWLKVSAARRAVKIIIYTPFLAFLFLIVVFFFVPAQPLGYLTAHWDISHGLYRVTVLGGPWYDDLSKMLRDEYGITTRRSEGCLQSIFQSTYNSGYQSVVSKALSEKYGRDVVRESVEIAKESWERKLAKSQISPQ